MSKDIIMKATGERYRKLGFYTYLVDFANILKAFIGSNFLSIPFGFSQCGLAIGVVALLLITSVTCHCSQLLVKAKQQAIKRVLHAYLHPKRVVPGTRKTRGASWRGGWRESLFSTELITDHLLPPELLEQNGGDTRQRKEQARGLQRRLVQSMQYGDLARACFGQFGVAASNLAILFTQIMFCIMYAVFTSSTIHGFFPVYNCTVQLRNNAVVTSPDCQYLVDSPWLPEVEKLLNDSGTNGNVSVGYVPAENPTTSLWTAAGSDKDFIADNFTRQNHSVVPSSSIDQQWLTSSQPLREPEKTTPRMFSSSSSTLASPASGVTGTLANFSDMATSASKFPVSSESITPSSSTSLNVTSPPNANHSTSETQVLPGFNPTSWSGPTVWGESWTDSPDLRVLFVIPVVLFMILLMPRRMRALGPISITGSLALVTGTLVILATLIAQFQMSDTWTWARWEGLPIFFGTVASSYEGAGTVLSVEASMEGNRHNYGVSLTGAIVLLATLHTSIGALSYLAFGSDTAQVVSMNLDVGSWLGVAVNACLMVGIVLTFPIMAYPILQLLEPALLLGGPGGKGRCCGGKGKTAEDEPLLLSESESLHTAVATDAESAMLQVEEVSQIPMSTSVVGGWSYPVDDASCKRVEEDVPSWKRNVVRMCLVLVAGVCALLLRSYFAYIASFMGSLGSIFVAYIFPCLFHLKVCWHQLPLALKVKDMFIIALGLGFSVTGVSTVIIDMIG